MKTWLLRNCPTFTRMYVWWRDHLTVVGKIVSLAMLVALPTVADADAAWAILFLAGAALLLITNLTNLLYRPRLHVRVACPQVWMCSTTRTVPITITNRGRWPVYDLEIDLLPVTGLWETQSSPAVVSALSPGATATVRTAVRALRRGRFPLPQLRATTLFPLQLVRRGVLYSLPRHPVILPFYRTLRSFAMLRSAPNVTHGTTLSFQTVGMDGEYVGSREYQPGMPVRKWDHPSWARLGLPVVREYCDPRHPAAALVLDTFFPPPVANAAPEIPELEALLSLAAATAESLLTREYGIELLVVGDQLLFLSSHSTYAIHHVILEHLALAQPHDADSFQPLVDQLQQVPLNWDMAIVISHQWDVRQETLFRAVTRHRVAGKRIVVRDHNHSRGGQYERSAHLITCSQVAAGTVDL